MKQRLIGAAVLVALAVIFLPMLLDGPEDEAPLQTESIPLDIPETPRPALQTRELDLDRDRPSPAAAPAAETLPTVETDAPQRVDAVSGEVVGSTADEPARAEDSPEDSPLQSPPTAAPTPAAAEPAVPAGGRYVVNLGSYAQVSNAEALLQRVRDAGIAAYAESVGSDGGAVRRVRAGPFAQRAEAERARQTINGFDADIPTSVVSLEPQEAAPAPARPAVTSGFAVQVGAFRDQAEADALRDRLRGADFTAFVERVDAEAGALWRVRVGPELDRAKADALRRELGERFGLDGLTVSHP